jgi:hypothetical protein
VRAQVGEQSRALLGTHGRLHAHEQGAGVEQHLPDVADLVGELDGLHRARQRVADRYGLDRHDRTEREVLHVLGCDRGEVVGRIGLGLQLTTKPLGQLVELAAQRQELVLGLRPVAHLNLDLAAQLLDLGQDRAVGIVDQQQIEGLQCTVVVVGAQQRPRGLVHGLGEEW